jgi:hypothetical protein
VATLEAFYDDDRRQESREVWFGSGWQSSKEELFEFLVFWVADTEEVCLLRTPLRDVQSDGVLSRFVLGIPPHVNPRPLGDEEATVEVLAKMSEKQVGEALEGWQDHLGNSGGVEWLRRALDDLAR